MVRLLAALYNNFALADQRAVHIEFAKEQVINNYNLLYFLALVLCYINFIYHGLIDIRA